MFNIFVEFQADFFINKVKSQLQFGGTFWPLYGLLLLLTSNEFFISDSLNVKFIEFLKKKSAQESIVTYLSVILRTKASF